LLSFLNLQIELRDTLRSRLLAHALRSSRSVSSRAAKAREYNAEGGKMFDGFGVLIGIWSAIAILWLVNKILQNLKNLKH